MTNKELITYLKKLIEITEKDNISNELNLGVEISIDMAKQFLKIIQKQDILLCKLYNKLIADKMEQLDDYVIYFIDNYLEILEYEE